MKVVNKAQIHLAKIKGRVNFKFHKLYAVIIIFVVLVFTFLGFFIIKQIKAINTRVENLSDQNVKLKTSLDETSKSYDDLKNQDQVKINNDLKSELNNIKSTYGKAVSSYENLVRLKEKTDKTQDYDQMFTDALVMLTKENYSSASAKLNELDSGIVSEENKLASSYTVPQNVPENNSPPSSGYSRQRVKIDSGTFLVSIIAADLSNTKVIVDTASDSSCTNDCPVLPLATYVSRNNAFAGINGSYFCPATYPSCAGKTNSFDTLLMNKNKTYFNSDNNVYSTVPAVIFGNGWIRFVGQSLDWGRDTSIDSMIANRPMLVQGGNVAYAGTDQTKELAKGGRSFVANKGNTVYIGVVSNATVEESAKVMKVMGMENALNLDDGGSTALWSGGYKVGPGRNLPNVILFVKK